METCVWHSEPRRGRLIQHASQPSPWRWMQTWWQRKTPTNLEVRPLAGTRGLQHWLELYLLPACLLLPHSSFVSVTHAFRRWHLSPRSLAFSVFLVHQVSFLHVTALYVDWEMLWQHSGHLSSCQTLSNSLLYVYSDLCFCMLLIVCDRFYCMNGHFDSFLLVLNLSLWLYFISF